MSVILVLTVYHYSMSTEDAEFKDKDTNEKVCIVLCWYAMFSLCVCTQSIPPQQIKQPLPAAEYMVPADAVKLYKQVTTTQ